MKISIICISFLLLFFSCGKNAPAQVMVPIEVQFASQLNTQSINSIKINKSSSGISWKQSYTMALSETLSDPKLFAVYNTEINAQDLELVSCKNFNALDPINKKVFYIVFMAAIAEAESDFRSNLKELNPGDGTTNIGLLQIDEDVANKHTKGNLGIINEDDLTDSKINLQSGAYILKNQLGSKAAKGRLFPPKSYYWQALTAKSRVLKNIQSNRSSIRFCD